MVMVVVWGGGGAGGALCLMQPCCFVSGLAMGRTARGLSRSCWCGALGGWDAAAKPMLAAAPAPDVCGCPGLR